MSNEIKHTPGPWRVVELNSAPNVLAHSVATSDFEPVASHMTLPDAKLISATPDLLAALENIIAFQDKDHPKHEAVVERLTDDFLAIDECPNSELAWRALREEALAAITKATT